MRANFYPHEKAFELKLAELKEKIKNLISVLDHCNTNADTILGNPDLDYVQIFLEKSNNILLGEILDRPELLNNDWESILVLQELLKRRSPSINTNSFLNTASNGYLGLSFKDKTFFPLTNHLQYVFDEKSWFLFHGELYKNNLNDVEYFKNTKNPILPFIDDTEKLITYSKKKIDLDKLYDKNNAYLKSLGVKASEREAFYRDIGEQIANLNFYTFNKDVSDYNDKMKNDKKLRSKRQKNSKGSVIKTKSKQTNRKKATKYYIYETKTGNDKIYLSLDLEKGAFEVCNSSGMHQGEWLFNGTKSAEAEKGHSIFIPNL